MSHRGLFLDRDGTLIRDVHYLRYPADVELVPGAAAALKRFIDAGIVPVVITNQSGIARGLLTEADYAAVHAEVARLFANEGVTLAGAYHCPHHPEHAYLGVTACDCRKPGTRLYRLAAEDLDLDPATSLFIGDRWRDVAPALQLGGRGILVPSPDTPADEIERAGREAQVAADLDSAASLVLQPLAE